MIFFINSQLVRVQSPDGTKRVEISSETLSQFYENVFREFKLNTEQANDWGLFTDREKQNRLPISRSKRASDSLKHGDMVYLLQATSQNVTSVETNLPVEIDKIDLELDKKDGRIFRKKDDLL